MELLLLVGGLGALCALALRYGHDSRDGLRSEEQTLATFGFSWHGEPRDIREPYLPATREQQQPHPLRRRIATVLNGLADWLYPVPDSQPGTTFPSA